MKVKVIRVDGSEEAHEIRGGRPMQQISDLIHADGLDTVNLRHDDLIMLVDDLGLQNKKSANPKATELYHSVCRPGTTWQILGDVAIVNDNDFA